MVNIRLLFRLIFSHTAWRADPRTRHAQSAQQYLATLGDAPTARSGIQGANVGSLTKSGGGQQLAVGSPSGKVYLAPGGRSSLTSAD